MLAIVLVPACDSAVAEDPLPGVWLELLVELSVHKNALAATARGASRCHM
ncbi:MAG: hypothetical protein J4F97_00485 [Pseudomonadales bacterium]|nr:hypothetical protein [Pseudomonadales bacterium]